MQLTDIFSGQALENKSNEEINKLIDIYIKLLKEKTTISNKTIHELLSLKK